MLNQGKTEPDLGMLVQAVRTPLLTMNLEPEGKEGVRATLHLASGTEVAAPMHFKSAAKEHVQDVVEKMRKKLPQGKRFTDATWLGLNVYLLCQRPWFESSLAVAFLSPRGDVCYGLLGCFVGFCQCRLPAIEFEAENINVLFKNMAIKKVHSQLTLKHMLKLPELPEKLQKSILQNGKVMKLDDD